MLMSEGLMVWALGLLGNIFHDDELREIRRAALRNQKKREQEKDEGRTPSPLKWQARLTSAGQVGEKKGVDKVYMIPQNGLFRWIFYPHYLCEWIEWSMFPKFSHISSTFLSLETVRG